MDFYKVQHDLKSVSLSLSQGDLTCNFLDDLSPSSWTRRNLGPVIGSPATTNQRAAVNGNQKTLPAVREESLFSLNWLPHSMSQSLSDVLIRVHDGFTLTPLFSITTNRNQFQFPF